MERGQTCLVLGIQIQFSVFQVQDPHQRAFVLSRMEALNKKRLKLHENNQTVFPVAGSVSLIALGDVSSTARIMLKLIKNYINFKWRNLLNCFILPHQFENRALLARAHHDAEFAADPIECVQAEKVQFDNGDKCRCFPIIVCGINQRLAGFDGQQYFDHVHRRQGSIVQLQFLF